MQKQIIVLGLALVSLTGCGGKSILSPDMPSNTIDPSRARPTEGQVSTVHVVATSVQAHLAGAAPDSGWVVVTNQNTSIEMLTFKNAEYAPLTDAPVPAGSYDSMRLLTGAGCSVVVDGVPHPLDVPGNTCTLNGSFDLPQVGPMILQLDFNAGTAVHQTGNGHWKLKATFNILGVSLLGDGATAPVAADTPTGGPGGRGGSDRPRDLVY
jgi:hypothetical protein